MTSPMHGSNNEQDVVLSGLSGRLPESDSIEEFAQQLFAGVDLVTEDDRRWTPGLYGLPERQGKLKNLGHFDASFFGVHSKQAHLMDPQLRLLLEVAHETIVDAGLSPAELRGSRTGVFVGVSNSETEDLLGADMKNITGYGVTGCARAMFANRVSYAFDFKGPSHAVDSACASSMYALAHATNAIRNGLCDAAVVAGTHVCLKPETSLHFLRLNMLGADGRCATFDASGRGYVRSEAVVAVLLQRRRDARRVYCTVRGANMNNDGHKASGITHPAGFMQSRLAQEVFAAAGLRPQDVAYVEAHGTGTKAGDPEEVNAIADLFCKDRQTPLLVGAVKSNMGHAEPASGLCAVVKVVLAMERGVIPGNLHFENPNKNIPALTDGRIKVVDKNTPWDGGLVAVNSFGFGGANAHAVLEGGSGTRPPPATYPAPRLVLASGRTDDAVKKLLKLAIEHQRDAELHALLDAVHARAIPGHPRRGYAVLDPARGSAPVLEVLDSEAESRPVWFVFSGVGSQWPGMARELMRLPTFSASIARLAAALEPCGVDLVNMITEAPDAAFDDIINTFVSIAAVQVALVDVLRELGVRPDGIIGSSCGEIGCAYADETLTAEQAVLCAYWRGRSVVEARPEPGAMAVVGLSWEEAARHCVDDVECVGWNSPEDILISGPLTSIEKSVAALSAEGVFTQHIKSSGVAFHSKYIAAAAPILQTKLLEVIPEPKPRSKRWLSSSIPHDQWDSDLAKLSDAAYHVNNFLSPVRFAEVLARVPEHALLVELAPHAQMQAVLKRALPAARHVPLVRRNAPDALTHLLAAVGKAYAGGAQPQVARLYPSVSWPVSRGTPSLASHIGWDHSTQWAVAKYKTGGRSGETIVEFDLSKPDDQFIAGHNIDGRILFPATGYMTMVWRTLAMMNNLKMEDSPVVFENLHFRRATIVPRNVPLRFLVNLLSGSGEFEICESGEVAVTGKAWIPTDLVAERLPISSLGDDNEDQEETFTLDSEDIYKVLRLRGYKYNGAFRGSRSSNTRRTRGLLDWAGNWTTFLDTMLQFKCLSVDTRKLYLITGLRRAFIDPVAQRIAAMAAASSGGAIPIKVFKNINVTVAGGVELRGLKTSLAPRRAGVGALASPKLEKCVFVPLDSGSADTAENRQALVAAVLLALENVGLLKMRVMEAALKHPVEALLLPRVLQVLEVEPRVRADATLACGADAAQYVGAMEPLGVKVSDKEVADGGLPSDCHLVLGVDVLGRHGLRMLSTLVAACVPTGLVLLDESAQALDDPATKALLAAANLTVVSHLHVPATSRAYVLLRRAHAVVPETKIVVQVRVDDYAWVDDLKEAMKRADKEDLRVYLWSNDPDSGVQGLVTCLRHEVGGDRLRMYYLPGARETFDPDAPAYRAQVERDLAFNVLRDGVWGTYRLLLLDDTTEAQRQVEHAYVNTLTRGDLSSLRWIESDLRHAAATPQRPHTVMCRVYYAPLNFRDVMLATGKLPPDALPGDLNEQECILGLEFSGRSSTGKRVMGMVPAKGLATTVLADETLMWEVPEQWSLEEAATVPVAYSTAYYALVVRGRMRRGETVLVHAGAGGVGQAAITIALHAGCTVYTTVGTPEKRAFLINRFPQLSNSNSIGNSRDCSFEQLIMRRTGGRGVDLVLNSLAGDKLQASLHCLAEGGRFLEIGKVDLSANTALGMAVLLKNTTVHGILLDTLFDGRDDNPDKAEMVKCMNEGIAAGTVRPLPTTIYASNQLEQAFRYMATGKFIGKVLIRVREEEAGDAPAPARLPSVMPRTYMHPAKSYVLVGGLGGIGLELGEWLVSHGARTLVFTSRSGVRTGYQILRTSRWREAGVRVLVSTTDASTAAGARALLREAAAAAPVGGIFNLAGVRHDALIENQTPEHFQAIARPKIIATRELDAASRELAPELDHFVAFSSVSSGRGEHGMNAYGFANSGMERVCERRRAAGLPGLAVQWGAVGDVGMVVDMLGPEDAVIGGTASQPIDSCLETLGTMMAMPYALTCSTVVAQKRRKEDKSTRELLQNVADILGVQDVAAVSETATLAELGMDSLMGSEIKQLLERDTDLVLSQRETRALTFRALREIGDATDAAAGRPLGRTTHN